MPIVEGPQDLRHFLGGSAQGDQQRRRRVTEIVEPHRREPGTVERGAQMVQRGVMANRPAIPTGKHQSEVMPRGAGCQAPLQLTPAALLEDRCEGRGECCPPDPVRFQPGLED